MGTPCLIVGTRLALHREVLAGTIGKLRPGIALRVMRPDRLRAGATCCTPRLVIASDTETIERLRPFASILLFPHDANAAFVNVGGNSRAIGNASIADILAVIDLVWSVAAPEHDRD